MVNKGKRIRKVLLAVVGLAVVGALALAGITAYMPLPLPFIDSYLRGVLDQNYHSFDVEFDESRVQWHLIDGIVELQVDAVRAKDMGGEVIATIPEIDIGLDLASLVQGELKLHYLTVQRARVRLFRTAGGAVKFDIGERTDGSSGKILEDLLVDIAAAPALVEGKAPDFPIISAVETEIELGDEVSGADLRIPRSQVRLQSDSEGVRGTYVLEVATGGERLRLSAESLFRTADQRTDLTVELDGVRPAIVGEILPNLRFFAPVEIPFSGSIKLELDKFLAVSLATFDLVGEKGSLEIAEYGGTNLKVQSARAVGTMSDNFSHLTLTDLQFVLNQGEITVQGLIIKEGPIYSFGLDLTVSANDPVALFPRWFAQIETALSRGKGDLPTREDKVEIAFDGRYDEKQSQIFGTGIISPSAASGSASKNPDVATHWFSAQGSVVAPDILITPFDTDPAR